MKTLRLLLALTAAAFAARLPAQITTFSYQTAANQALLSDKYDVFVRVGGGAEQQLQVLMSNVINEGDWQETNLTGRTFSFTQLDYNPAGGALTFRVVKRFGAAATAITVHPASYAITPSAATGTSTTFTVSANNRYLSVYFDVADNKITPAASTAPGVTWIRHMLCIFIDPPETGKPTPGANGVVTYTSTTPAPTLTAATTLYFPAGHHNLRSYSGGTAAINDGILQLQNGQSVYLEGGAFVEGLLQTTSTSHSNQKIFGRGILSGRLHPWYNKPGYSGPSYNQIARFGNNNATIEGVMMMESPSHGVVSSNNARIRNFKYLGWHSNNDAIRVGSGSEIANSFIRAVDDHFYNFDIWVHDCVLWAGHNGAILTYGWGANGTYNSGSSLLENIDIIHPEWINLGNNNTVVASQTALDYKPFGYSGGNTLTILQNIRIEGVIPALLNLKPLSQSDGTPSSPQVPLASVGYLGDLFLSNITINSQFGKNRLRGKVDASSETTDATNYFVRNVEFNNITVGTTLLTEANKATYADIEAATTTDIRFSGNTAPAAPTNLAVGTPTTSSLVLTWTDNATNETAYRVQRSTASTGPWTDLTPDLAANAVTYTATGLTANTTYYFRVAALNTTGTSSYAGPASATTTATTTPPTTPPPTTPPPSSGGGGGGGGAPSLWFFGVIAALAALRRKCFSA